jgi:predicted Zn-dependent protease
MNPQYLILIFSCVISISFSQEKKNITYDLSCLDTDAASSSSSLLGDVEKDLLNAFGTEVSISEEIELGETLLKDTKNTSTIIENGDKLKKIENILSKLKKEIVSPKGFDYKIYLIENSMLNAFTIGGKIFFTTGMYDFCVNDNEIACIIGHEISHNELGHINDQIKRSKTATFYLGQDFGGVTAMIGNILTTPFNQKNEAHCDLLGIDLAYRAGYAVCENVKLWERMSLKEDSDNIMYFFSSHPYSLKRSDCSKRHIESNYNLTCPK